MDTQRNLLIAGLLFVSFLLYQQWQIDNAPQQPQPTEQVASTVSGDIPASSATMPQASGTIQAQRKTITVVTDLLQLSIDTRGGDIVESTLLTYPVEMDAPENFKLLEQQPHYTFIA